MKAMFCCYHHSSVSLFSFHIKMITAVYLQNDSSILLEWSFKWNVGIVLQVKCCYRFVTHLSWVLWIADSAHMSNKTITAFYLQNDSSISLEWSFKWNAGIILFISYPKAIQTVQFQGFIVMMITTKRCFHSICFGP